MTNNDLPEVPKLVPPPMNKDQKPKPVRPWDMFNKNKERVSKDIKDARMSICESCPFLIQATKQCKKCGCLMHLKTQLADAYCPMGKWHQVDPSFKE
jgi:hypothetical protein